MTYQKKGNKGRKSACKAERKKKSPTQLRKERQSSFKFNRKVSAGQLENLNQQLRICVRKGFFGVPLLMKAINDP